MLDIIVYIILSLLFIFYLLIVSYFVDQYFKLRRYKPYYNYDILDYADEIKKRTGISKIELKRIIKRSGSLTIRQLIAISDVMGCDLNHLVCSFDKCLIADKFRILK